MQKNEQTFDIKRYLTIILNRKYIALSVGLGVLSVFTWGNFLMPKTYRASTTVAIERSKVLSPLLQGIGVSENMADRFKYLKNEITGRSITDKAIKRLGMDALAKNPAQYEALIEGIRNKLDVLLTGGPDFFNITYSGNDPKKAADIVNAITQTYIDEHMQSRRTNVSEAYEFIHNQLLEYKNKLEASDSALREFRENHPRLVTRSETTLVTKMETLENAKKETEIKLKELMSMRDILKEQISYEKELTVAFVSREGSPLDARLNVLNNQLVLLMMKYTDKYPEVIKVKSEIEELKKHLAQKQNERMEGASSETTAMNPLYQRLKEQITTTESEIGSLKARLSEISKQQGEVQATLGGMPKEQEEWTKLQRDRNVSQQIYEQLLQKLENAKVSKDLELSEKGETFRFVDPAQIPLAPSKPDRVQMILLGIFLGIASGIGVVFGLEHFDHSFKDEDSIEASLNLPVLATIPKMISEADEQSVKRFDRKILIASGAYLSLIGFMLIGELLSRYLGIKIINF